MPREGRFCFQRDGPAEAGRSSCNDLQSAIDSGVCNESGGRRKHGLSITITSNDFVDSFQISFYGCLVWMQPSIEGNIRMCGNDSECLAPYIDDGHTSLSMEKVSEGLLSHPSTISRGTGFRLFVLTESVISRVETYKHILVASIYRIRPYDLDPYVEKSGLRHIDKPDQQVLSQRDIIGGLRGIDENGLVNSAGTVSYSASQRESCGFRCGHPIDASPFRSAGRSVSSAVRRVLYVGGYSNTNSSNAPKYGLSYANANNDLSNSNTNIGGRLTRFSSTKHPDVGLASLNAKHTVDVLRPSSTVLRNEGDENKGNSMPISINNLKSQIIDMANLRSAAKQCCSRRRDKAEVARFKDGWEEKLVELRKMLEEETYETSKYRYFERWEHGKLRKIADLPLYPDRILRQAFAQVLAPELDRKLIPQTHASRKDHGTHSALKYACKCIRKHPKIRYGMSIDAVKCYESIDKRILKSVMSRMISDKWVLRHLFRFIDDYELGGISIGDSLSPLFCNCYFNEIDHHMYETMRCHAYVAYADNRFIFGNSRKWLMKMKDEIERKFSEYGLRIHSNWHIADLTKEGLDFLGYRIFKDHVRLRKSTKERFIRSMKRMMQKLESGLSLDKHDLGSLNSYKGVLRWCNSKNLYNRYCKPVIEAMERLEGSHSNPATIEVMSSSKVNI